MMMKSANGHTAKRVNCGEYDTELPPNIDGFHMVADTAVLRTSDGGKWFQYSNGKPFELDADEIVGFCSAAKVKESDYTSFIATSKDLMGVVFDLSYSCTLHDQRLIVNSQGV